MGSGRAVFRRSEAGQASRPERRLLASPPPGDQCPVFTVSYGIRLHSTAGAPRPGTVPVSLGGRPGSQRTGDAPGGLGVLPRCTRLLRLGRWDFADRMALGEGGTRTGWSSLSLGRQI